MTRPDGQTVFSIEKQISFLRDRFIVDFSNGQDLQIRSRITFLKKKIDIGPETEALMLEGDVWDHRFQLLKAGQLIGEVRKKWISWGDSYELDVLDPRYETIFVAVVLAVDAILDEEAAAAAANSSH